MTNLVTYSPIIHESLGYDRARAMDAVFDSKVFRWQKAALCNLMDAAIKGNIVCAIGTISDDIGFVEPRDSVEPIVFLGGVKSVPPHIRNGILSEYHLNNAGPGSGKNVMVLEFHTRGDTCPHIRCCVGIPYFREGRADLTALVHLDKKGLASHRVMTGKDNDILKQYVSADLKNMGCDEVRNLFSLIHYNYHSLRRRHHRLNVART